MDKIKITFLGTSSAIPTPSRNHTGIFLSFSNENLLVDCGENIQRQMRIAKISPTKITRILITHWHGDHILGLPGLFQTLAMSNHSKPIHLYGPKGTNKNLFYISNLIRGIKIPLQIHEISRGIFLNENLFQIEALPMNHNTPTLAYSLKLKDRLRFDKKKIEKLKISDSLLFKQILKGKNVIINGRKISAKSLTYIEKGKKISIMLDTAFCNNTLKIAKDSDILIAESSFSSKDEKIAEEYKHLTSKQAATIAKESRSRRLILSHISERYEHSPNTLEKEAKKVFKNTLIAKDFDVIIV